MLTLTGSDTNAGTTTIYAGTLQIGTGGTRGSLAGNVSISPGATLIFDRSDTETFDGVITLGAQGSFRPPQLIKTGAGVLVLTQAKSNGSSNYNGNITVSGGALRLDFQDSTAVTGVVSTLSSLILAGGQIDLNSRANASVTQLFAGTTIGLGDSAFTEANLQSGATAGLYLSAVTRQVGGTVDFESARGAGNATTTGTGIFSTLTNSSVFGGIIGGWATTSDGTEWAVATGSTGAAFSGQNHIYGGAVYRNSFSTGNNTDMTANLSVASGRSTGSLRFNTPLAATLTLGGTDTVSSGGVLVTPNVGGKNVVITGGRLISGNGQDLIVIQNNPAGSLTINSIISGAVALTKGGVGTLILGAPNSFTGNVVLNGGLTALNASGALGSGKTLYFGQDAGMVGAPDGTATPMSGPTAATLALNGYSLSIGAVNSFGTAVAVPVIQNGASSAVTLSVSSGSASMFSGILQDGGPGALALAKSGSGNLTLTGINTYSGGTSISGGLINFNAPVNFGTGVIMLSGGGLQWAAGSSADISGQLAPDGLAFPTFDTNGNNVSFATGLSGTGNFTKAGAGVLTLTGPNYFTGIVQVTGGLINFSSLTNFGTENLTLNGGGLQWAAGNSADISPLLTPLTASGATFDTNGNDVTFASALSGPGGFNKLGHGTLTLLADSNLTGNTTINGGTLQIGAGGSTGGVVGNVSVALGATLAFDRSDSFSPAGLIAGYGLLTKSGGGTLTFSGGNPFGGNIVVAAGTLALGSANALAGSPSITLATNTVLDLANNDNTIGYLAGTGNVFLGRGNLTVTSVAIFAPSLVPGFMFNSSYSGTITTTFDGVISGTGSLIHAGASWGGSGTLVLTGNNTYTGGTTILGGYINFNSLSNFGSGNITLNGGGLQWSNGNTLDISSRLAPFGPGGGNFDLASNNVTLSALPVANVPLSKVNGGTLTLSGPYAFSSVNASGGTLALMGTGVVGSIAVTGNNGTSTGGSVLSDSNLILNQSTQLVGDITLTFGSLMLAAPYQLTGILKGTGTINGAVVTVLSGTQLAPSSGTLTFSNGLTLNQGAILTVNSGPGYTTPSINVSGGFLTGNAGPGGITLNVADVFGMAVGTYDFITAATIPSVDPAEFAIGTAPAGYVYGVSLDGSSLALVVSAIPEPVTFGAWAGAALLVLAGYRRWRAAGPRQS